MDGSQLIESLDCLWFFTNVLSRTMPVGQASDINITKEEPPKPMSPIVQSHQSESSKTQFMSPRCPKCGEFAAEMEQHRVQPIASDKEVGISKPAKKEERMRRRRRKSKRKLLGELDLGLDGIYYKDCGFWLFDEETCGYGMLGSQPNQVKMPPLNDGMAMKEHLKCWAYAVACTVR